MASHILGGLHKLLYTHDQIYLDRRNSQKFDPFIDKIIQFSLGLKSKNVPTARVNAIVFASVVENLHVRLVKDFPFPEEEEEEEEEDNEISQQVQVDEGRVNYLFVTQEDQGRRVNYQEEDFPQVDDELSQAEADEDYEIDEEILHDDEIQFEEISSNNHYHGMVPADESSINNMMLNNKVIISPLNLKESHDHQQEDCCVVCLEQLAEVGSQVSQMPCSHQFHTACIQTWLNNSHYCPVCRYVMPAAQDS